MQIRCLVILVAFLSAIGANSTPYGYSQVNEQRHVEVSMRMIGHQVLIHSGDSASIILPVVKDENQYKISFGSDFGLDPEKMGMVIDSVIRATEISENYIVEFVKCDTKQVIHSYEIGEKADVLACQGRAQAPSCYELWISLLDTHVSEIEKMKVSDLSAENRDDDENSSLFITIAIGFAILVLTLLTVRRRPSKYQDPNDIKLGEFLFKKKSMELLFKQERIELTGKEAHLLQILSASVNDTVKREDLLKAVWGDDGGYVGRTLDVFISKLRKKLELDSKVRIVNIRGIGYKLVLAD